LIDACLMGCFAKVEVTNMLRRNACSSGIRAFQEHFTQGHCKLNRLILQSWLLVCLLQPCGVKSHGMVCLYRCVQKPDNFLMGTNSKAHQVYIIDFGLSKKYRDPKTLEVRPILSFYHLL